MELRVNSEEKYTYADYLTWDDDIRYELIDGIPYMMSAPNTAHQRISRRLIIEIGTYLKGKKCEVFAAPYDIRLNWDTKDDTVVQPDLVVYCDVDKIDKKGGKGAPDLVIEILSPSSRKMDRAIKRSLYEKSKVREYWIIDPENNEVDVFTLVNDMYKMTVYNEDVDIPVGIFEDFNISLSDVFE